MTQSVVFSQVAMEKVLVEMGTATWSYACATEVQMLNQMKEDGLHISIVNYHLNDPFANQYANQRASYYGIQNLPYPIVGGKNATVGNYDSYLSLYNESLNTPSSFSISATGHFSEDTLIMEVNLEKVANYESDTISLYLALTESDIEVNWQGLSKVDEVERNMTPNGNGKHLDFSESNTQSFTEKILFERDWDPEKMELVVFIQNDTNKLILQCYSQAIPDFAPLPVHAFFQVEDTSACVNEIVHFQNMSTGTVENIHWVFSGGTPNESSNYDPYVQYLSNGVFPVSLAVSNSISSDTLTIEEFMNIQALPDISFSSLPDFCHDEAHYQLTEGSPSGGQYFGLFVDTGYFFPMNAGLGDHPIFYSIQDEETGCSDTLSQNAYVYFCDIIHKQDTDKQSFPFYIYQHNGYLQIKPKEDFHASIELIQLFSMEGKLLHQKSYSKSDFKNHIFSLKPDNSLIIIRVKTANETYVVKHQF